MGDAIVSGGLLRWEVEHADLYVDSNTASVLVREAPSRDYVVETKVRLSGLPDEGCCFNYAQAGVVVYDDDDNFVNLTSASIWETRQTEFAKELKPAPQGWSRYGNTVVGPPVTTGPTCASSSSTSTSPTCARGGEHVAIHRLHQPGRPVPRRGGAWTHSRAVTPASAWWPWAPRNRSTSDHRRQVDQERAYSIRAGGPRQP